MRVASHTHDKSTDAMNRTHHALNSLTKLVVEHIQMVFLKSTSCSNCDFEVVGYDVCLVVIFVR